jgi:amino acid transporter
MSDPRDAAPRTAVRRKGSLLRTLLAVAWSFFGVRKSKDLERDVGELNPLHLVIAGVVVAMLFVGALIMLVHWVVGSGVAA